MSQQRRTSDGFFPCNPRERNSQETTLLANGFQRLIAPRRLGHKSRGEAPPPPPQARDTLRSLPRHTPPTSLFICKCHLLPPAGTQPAAASAVMNGAARALKGDPARHSTPQALPGVGTSSPPCRCTQTHHPQPPARTPMGKASGASGGGGGGGGKSPGPLTRLQTCFAAQGP